MKKRSSKKIVPTPEFDSQRETRVLLEQIRSEVRVVAEQHSDIIRRIESIENRLDRIENRLDRIENRLDRIENRLDRVESELGTVKIAVKELDTRLERAEKKLDAVTTDHEQRLQKLERV